ncbi:MAG: DUF3480 domain-containing protein [Gemmatimonadetes bacterium]|nr:DUF3480 domain-containing protein [Gemmatimonadota bacterium]NIO32918.1 DUF3480 domain-containing protein [Gemmatimonadota bacterium]
MPANTDPGDFPLHFELIPGELSARVWLHQIASMPCWSYTSTGLSAHGQRELILTVRVDQGEGPTDFPKEPLRVFVEVLRLAKAGRPVGSGDITELGGNGLLGHRGIVYTSTRERFADVEFPGGLAAILLRDEEIEAAMAFGITRVLGRLGQAYSHYPWPPWADRTRPSLPMARLLEDSILAQLTRIHAPGMTACLERDRIVLRLTEESGTQLLKQLAEFPASSPPVLLTELEPTADGCFVWKPGQSDAKAITAPNGTGSRLSGCFLALAPGQTEDEGLVVEDGLMMSLRDLSWRAIRDGLKSMSPVEVRPSNSGFGFALEWLAHDYANPVDGLTYRSEGGWRAYEPEAGPDKEEGGLTDLNQIVLLTPEHEIAQRLRIDELADYVEVIKSTVIDFFADQPRGAGAELMLQFEIEPSAWNASVKMASRPGVADATLQRLHDELCQLPSPSVTGGPVVFQMLFAIWGGHTNSGTDQPH